MEYTYFKFSNNKLSGISDKLFIRNGSSSDEIRSHVYLKEGDIIEYRDIERSIYVTLTARNWNSRYSKCNGCYLHKELGVCLDYNLVRCSTDNLVILSNDMELEDKEDDIKLNMLVSIEDIKRKICTEDVCPYYSKVCMDHVTNDKVPCLVGTIIR